MRVDGLDEVDWSAPWLAIYRDAAERIVVSLAAGASVAAALNTELANAAGLPRLAAGPIRFVAQADLPEGRAYESHIASTGRVPTRDNLHDLFNGLAWLHWPALKRRLNELQAAALRVQTPDGRRGALRDALTLFDENAALLSLPPVLEHALRRRDWQALFVEHRPAWHDARVLPFGHALIEKLVRPRKAITAHGWLLPFGLSDRIEMQSWLCEHLTAERLETRSHLPLPVLGIPGWWPANQQPGFYADSAVFRPLSADARDGDNRQVK